MTKPQIFKLTSASFICAVAILVVVSVLGWTAPAQALTKTVYNLGVEQAYVAYDNSSVWFSSAQDHVIKRVNPSNGSVTKTINPPADFVPGPIHWDGSYIWVRKMSGNNSSAIIRILGDDVQYYPGGGETGSSSPEYDADEFSRKMSNRYYGKSGTQPAGEIYKIDQSGNLLDEYQYPSATLYYDPFGVHAIDNNTLFVAATTHIPGQPSNYQYKLVRQTLNLQTLELIDSRSTSFNYVNVDYPGVSIWDGEKVWIFGHNYFDIRVYDPADLLTTVYFEQASATIRDAVYDEEESIYDLVEYNNNTVVVRRWNTETYERVQTGIADTSAAGPPMRLELVGDSIWVTHRNSSGQVTKYDFADEANLAITSGPTANPIGPRSATISWTTNTDSDTHVYYGPTTAYGTHVSSATMSPDHSRVLTGLNPNTTYHYKVRSCNGFVCVDSGDKVFTTTALVPPYISITDPVNNGLITTSPYLVVGRAGDNDGHVDTVGVRACLGTCTNQAYSNATNRGGAWAFDNWDKSQTFSSYGSYQLQAKATDNDSQSTVTSINVYRGAPPVVNIISHTNGQQVDTDTINLSGTATDADNNIDNPMRVQVNGGAWQPIDITSSQNVGWGPKTISLDVGGNTIRVEAEDATGFVGFKQIVVNRGQPPTINITSHEDGEIVDNDSVTISGTASDPDGSISQVHVRVNNGTWLLASGTATWSRPSIPLQPGENIIEARAKDNIGLYGYDAITLIYEAPYYEFSLVSDSPLTVYEGEQAQFTFNLTGFNNWSSEVLAERYARDNIPATRFSWADDNQFVPPSAPGQNLTLNINTANLVSDTYDLSARANKIGTSTYQVVYFQLIVADGPDFAISSADSQETIQPGSGATYPLHLQETTPVYNFDINLSINSIIPNHGGNITSLNFSTASLKASPYGSGDSTLTVTTNASLAIGTYTIQVKASGQDGSWNRTRYINLTLVVGDSPDYEILANPLSQEGELGGSVDYTLTLRETIPVYNWPVNVTLDQVWGDDEGDQSDKITTASLPNNITPSPNPGTDRVVTINISADAPPDTYTLTFKGVGTDLPLTQTHFATVELIIEEEPQPDFEVFHSDSDWIYYNISQGGSRIWDVQVRSINGFNEPVRMTIEDMFPNYPNEWQGVIVWFVDNDSDIITVTPPPDGTVDVNVVVLAGGSAECKQYEADAKGRDDQVVGPPDDYREAQINFKVVGCDTDNDPPVIDPASVVCLPGVGSITVNWTTDEPADGTLYYGTTSPPGSTEVEGDGYIINHLVTKSGLQEGADYYYQVESCDQSGNCTGRFPIPPGVCHTESFDDNEFPEVSWFDPTDGQTVSGTIPLKVTAFDNVGIVDVQFLVDGTSISTDTNPPGCAPYYCEQSWNTSSVSNGNHTLTAIAKDTSQNPGQDSITINVLNDSTAPICTGLEYQWGSNWATMTWATNEASDSRIYYCYEGTALGTCGKCIGNGYCANGQMGPLCYYCQAKIENTPVTEHAITIGGSDDPLESGQTYHFMAESCDAGLNCGQCGG
ncbi:MAG: Ig-like domain-containing protein [bacterium]